MEMGILLIMRVRQLYAILMRAKHTFYAQMTVTGFVELSPKSGEVAFLYSLRTNVSETSSLLLQYEIPVTDETPKHHPV